MELHQLEYFVAVADEEGFTRAAARLRVAQPGVSAQIRKLERELGLPLLDRTTRSVRLTAAGEAVLPFARAALTAVEGARQVADELSGLKRGRVAVGTVNSHTVDLATILADFHARWPGIEITLVEDASGRLADAVREGRLDAAIVAYAQEPEGLDLHVVTDEAIDAAVWIGHELAARETIRLTDLRDRALVCLPRGGGIRAVLDAACAEAGFTPRVAFEAGSPTVIEQLAARRLGIAILPESIARHREHLHPLRIIEPELRGRLGLAWRQGGPPSPAAVAWLDHARSYL
ncbi:LysR family transcriptional regulator [Dactylosporangium vinaceum]|uniref:LysR family transcriptional regulator n=1 Tax=Dactylosporangium vinaceum TaxID=53362 RepID=A0ABV5M002_9ACTN|nr:LysR family transcriptional regulator [Dactylosporangium vinaceum]UAB98117.1 LysR family transcriptional regulator [Dactylosporangium vinaceum]